jgi:hypothetical protein
MNAKLLYALWAAGYALCGVLGFVPNPTGALRVLLIILALASFLPPLLLIRTGKKHTLRLVRNLAALWLVLALVLILANLLSFTGSVLLGNVLYCLLVLVASPLVCGQYWVISLFGWAYVLFDSMNALKKA